MNERCMIEANIQELEDIINAAKFINYRLREECNLISVREAELHLRFLWQVYRKTLDKSLGCAIRELSLTIAHKKDVSKKAII